VRRVRPTALSSAEPRPRRRGRRRPGSRSERRRFLLPSRQGHYNVSQHGIQTSGGGMMAGVVPALTPRLRYDEFTGRGAVYFCVRGTRSSARGGNLMVVTP
jgi:hypothetical protein